tara:strand:- start:14213 stop:14719 length:507 start_codon:yes stop_codon:yes gene_type:complete
MQEWSLQSGSRKSTRTEKPFSDGQQVRSVLIVAEKEGLLRLDFHPDEEMDLGESRLVAQWLRTFRSNEAEREVAREAVATADELFDQMMNEEDDGEDSERAEVRATLCFLLALHLERKRVLRPKGRVGSDGFQVYRHPKKDCEYRVAAVELRPKLIQQIEDQLDFMLI